MFKKKITNEEPVSDIKTELITFLKAKLPTMFDRDPVVTGDVNKLAGEILDLVK